MVFKKMKIVFYCELYLGIAYLTKNWLLQHVHMFPSNIRTQMVSIYLPRVDYLQYNLDALLVKKNCSERDPFESEFAGSICLILKCLN